MNWTIINNNFQLYFVVLNKMKLKNYTIGN